MTPSARLRASHIVLAGNIHLGAPLRRLSETLLPVWRYAAVTEPLGERLAEVIAFQGSVTDSDGIDHFRIVDGDRLMWASPETTWDARPHRFGRRHRSAASRTDLSPARQGRDRRDVFGGAVGLTVHGMPQIGQLRKGLWVASGFGRQGLNTSAMAGQLIARSILWGDERWRLFSPFELVWAGGATGRVAGHLIGLWGRGSSAAAGALARYREGARVRERRSRGAPGRGQPAGRNRPPPRPSAGSDRRAGPRPRAAACRRAGRRDRRDRSASLPSQESEKIPGRIRVTSAAVAPYLMANTLRPPRTETSMIDRRILLASVASLFGLAAFRWLRATPAQAAEKFEVEKTDAEWRAQLTPQQYDILRKQGTERPGSSPLLKEQRKGIFACAGCDLPLFSSDTKFESGTGWPSF